MKLIKWILSVIAVAVAVAGIVYLVLTKTEQIMDRMEYVLDRIKGFFYDITDRFFSEEDFCECCSCCGDASDEEGFTEEDTIEAEDDNLAEDSESE